MSRGAAVIRYQGKRDAVWRIKYRDAAGKQIQETLGSEPPWTERKAQRELGKRPAAVEEGYRKPERVSFGDFAERFVANTCLAGTSSPRPRRTTTTSSVATSSRSSEWRLAKAIVLTALGTGMRRGELIGLRWSAVNLLEAKIDVREAFVRSRFTTPKSKASRRVVELGPRTLAVLEEQWRSTAYRGDDDLVFGHPTKGTPVDTSKLANRYVKLVKQKAPPSRAF